MTPTTVTNGTVPMSTFQAALKAEIVRLSRREIKRAVAPLKSAVSKSRSTIASLKAELAALAKKAAPTATVSMPNVADNELEKARFSGKLIRKLRAKLELSRAQFGKLVGVTGYAVIAWEGEQCRPNALRKRAIFALRKMGVRAAKQMVKAGGTLVG